MIRGAYEQKNELIKGLVEETKERLGGKQGALAAQFVGLYFDRVPPADIVEHGHNALYGSALAHWKLGARRQPDEAKVRVYNPSLEEHGWKSDHTVIEIINDDMPFLVDSVAAEFGRREIPVHLIIHPIINVQRKDGAIVALAGVDDKLTDMAGESFLHIEISRQSAAGLDEIRTGIEGVLRDVRTTVADWMVSREKVLAVAAELEKRPGPLAAEEAREVCGFLRWIHDNNFTLLGYREFAISGEGSTAKVKIVADGGLGLLRDPNYYVYDEFTDLENLRPEVRAFISRPEALAINKTDRVSTVHRPVYMDAISIRRFGAKGQVVGQHTFVGLFTSSAYNLSPRSIPLLGRKIARVIERAGLPANSHDGKALNNILENFPRDELFQVSEDHLLNTSLGVLNLQERRRVALFLRRDDIERFMSCLIYVPRDRFDTDLRQRMQGIMEEAFDGERADWYVQLSDSPLARIHMFIRTTPGAIPEYDADMIEGELIAAARSWTDQLENTLIAAHGEESGLALHQQYKDAFRSGYRERFDAEAAVGDIDMIEAALASGELCMSLRRPLEASENEVRFKLYHPDAPIPLSDVLPMLEHMGLKVVDEIPFAIRPDGERMAMIHDFGLQSRDGRPIDLGTVRAKFQEAFLGVWRGEVESDAFNGLVVRAGLSWREIVIIRAYCKYLRQAGIAFSQSYMEQTVLENPDLAALVVRLFLARFDPAGGKGAKKKAAGILADLDAGLDAVTNADQDRIVRRFINLIQSTQRTNFFQPGADGEPKSYVSFKLDSQAIEELPLPRPLVEIWVYSPRTECVHLRGGRVARGGIRWSDRPEDFRTEILGLMKAQMVKNAVIVPVGSKGGFILKRTTPPGDREAWLAEGIECYKILMRGLLDVTDDLKGSDVVPPLEVVRHDGDDPYLVVAADKGTATFSDIANGVSIEYGFWLDDAFASGGSQGYDHKGMGITARGAWESVKRHFREIGVNTQTEDFSVVGVGDMSGDVFGNGMLLSKHIKLIAAFNHLHIFVDPDPDPAKTFAERKRMFELPRSSWADFDKKLLSKGGEIFERSAKTLKLSKQIQARFGFETDTVTPNELLLAILKAEVDLLWFGGIGTYVKASGESQLEAGDRANDAIRVNAPELRCKVLAEGANLGATQRGRIEYALSGGRLNTDAIDNSAGVDCSDHEVNIKVLLGAVVAEGDMTMKQRNTLLEKMTDEVGLLVLRDNYLQTQAISRGEAQGIEYLDDQARFMRFLERDGLLNRAVEFLPDEETLVDRRAAKQGLTRPELSVLVPYAKLWLYEKLLASDLPDDPRLVNDLVRYFPEPLHVAYRGAIESHRLRREIIATIITNSMVNRIGGTFVMRLMEETGMPPAEIARAYTIVRKVFNLRELWQEVEGLDYKAPAAVQIAMLHEINRLVERATLWFLRSGTQPLDISAQVAAFQDGLATLRENLANTLTPAYLADLKERAGVFVKQGVPEDLAIRVAAQVNLYSGLDIIRLAGARKMDVVAVSRIYFSLGGQFRLGRLRAAAESLSSDTHWQKLAVRALVEEIYTHQSALTAQVLDTAGKSKDPAAIIEKWIGANESAVARTEQMLAELWTGKVDDLAMIAVASRQLRSLAVSSDS
ncbi:MAG: NAD-glutamate dehydrogenase [Rhodospirillales bacterium]|jgi:glutamate dehydrogenase|nr:NAD-glutamate dehydrogenase [Rhodospirillales bacterium]